MNKEKLAEYMNSPTLLSKEMYDELMEWGESVIIEDEGIDSFLFMLRSYAIANTGDVRSIIELPPEDIKEFFGL